MGHGAKEQDRRGTRNRDWKGQRALKKRRNRFVFVSLYLYLVHRVRIL